MMLGLLTLLSAIALLAHPILCIPATGKGGPQQSHGPSPALRRALLDRRQQSPDSAFYPQYGYDITKCQGESGLGRTFTSLRVYRANPRQIYLPPLAQVTR
jgi:hypothetical protein